MDISQLRRTLAHRLVKADAERGGLAPSEMTAALRQVLMELSTEDVLPEIQFERLYADLVHEAMLYGPLWRLLFDADVSEVMVNGPEHVFVERHGVVEHVDLRFRDANEVRHVIDKMLQLDTSVRIDVSRPWCDLALPDGSRANFVIPPIVPSPHLTIRKYQGTFRGMDDFVKVGSLDERMGTLLVAATRAKLNLLFSGASASGKTTLLEVLGRTIPANERVICIEDTQELHFDHPNVVRMLTRPSNFEGKGEVTTGDLFRNALRMAPDRVLLGEIRGREAYEYLQALNSGHAGSLAVIHAASPEEAVVRLQNLVPLAGLGVPPAVVKRQIAHGLDLVVQLEQGPDGARRVTRITEIRGLDAAGDVVLVDLFAFVADRTGPTEVTGSFRATGEVPAFLPRLARAGMGITGALFQPH
jgi:pilus assembly protein CpaF